MPQRTGRFLSQQQRRTLFQTEQARGPQDWSGICGKDPMKLLPEVPSARQWWSQDGNGLSPGSVVFHLNCPLSPPQWSLVESFEEGRDSWSMRLPDSQDVEGNPSEWDFHGQGVAQVNPHLTQSQSELVGNHHVDSEQLTNI